MSPLYGLDVIVHPLVEDKPKLKFDASFLGGGSTKVIEDFNRWLIDQFGWTPTYIRIGNRIYTSKLGIEMLKKASVKGGSA